MCRFLGLFLLRSFRFFFGKLQPSAFFVALKPGFTSHNRGCVLAPRHPRPCLFSDNKFQLPRCTIFLLRRRALVGLHGAGGTGLDEGAPRLEMFDTSQGAPALVLASSAVSPVMYCTAGAGEEAGGTRGEIVMVRYPYENSRIGGRRCCERPSLAGRGRSWSPLMMRNLGRRARGPR